MVTASHNPGEDNGMKLVDGNGNMLETSWERIAEEIVNAPTSPSSLTMEGDGGNSALRPQTLLEVMVRLIEEEGLNIESSSFQTNSSSFTPQVVLGMDTRPHSPSILRSIQDCVNSLGGECIIQNCPVTTPMLHTFVTYVNESNNSIEELDQRYIQEMVQNYCDFVQLAQINDDEESSKSDARGTIGVFVDCAHGVGFPILSQISSQINGNNHLTNHTQFEFIPFNSHEDGELNLNCGADFVQKGQIPPENAISLFEETECENSLGCSFDGDADRIVFFQLTPTTNKNNQESQENESFRFNLIDGDQIMSLICQFLNQELEKLKLEIQTESDGNNDDFNPTSLNLVAIQTAYANGFLILFILLVLVWFGLVWGF